MVSGKLGTVHAATEACLEYHSSAPAQILALKHYYRAWNTSQAAPEDIVRVPEVNPVSIADLGRWPVGQTEYFGEGGIFDQIYGV